MIGKFFFVARQTTTFIGLFFDWFWWNSWRWRWIGG